MLVVNKEKVVFKSKINKNYYRRLSIFTKLYKVVLHNCLKVKMGLTFINNQIFTR